MTKPLNDEQKELIFDYCMGLTNEEKSAEADHLIFSNAEAQEIHAKLQAALDPLEKVEFEKCPDHIVENTVLRLNEAAREAQERLEALLANEQVKTIKIKSPLHNFGKVLAAAAAILIFAGLFFTSTNYMRHHAWNQQCQMQLMSGIYPGLLNYMSDYDGKMPCTGLKKGQPWWKKGYQGEENSSNTRRVWLLVKEDYVDDLKNFICPGNEQSRQLDLALRDINVDRYNDFPTRWHITYSVRLRCPKSVPETIKGQKVLIADLNPLFENLPEDYNSQLSLSLNEKLEKLNSINHNRKGQNVLFCNGGVIFTKERHTNISEDDIYTLRDTEIYRGIEIPTTETDDFLAP
ncbi:MAG: hypothetical protein ACYTFM_01705 [Planctomycetota bacterium]|jgi:hypothetical protein